MRAGLQQLLRYDGDFSRRVKGEDDVGHHFDRARTYVMAADYLMRSKRQNDWRAAQEGDDIDEYDPEDEKKLAEGIPFGLFNRDRDKLQRQRRESVFTIPTPR